MNRQVQIIVLAVAALVLGGGGFVAGMTVGPEFTFTKSDASPQAATAARQQGQGGPGGRQLIGGAGAAAAGALAGGGAQTIGRVISVNDGSITIEVRTPGSDTPRSVIALVGASARVVKTVETDIKLSDIKAGDQVLVVGAQDQATGTISATAVVDGFNVLGGFGGGPGGQGGARPAGSGAPRPSPSGSPRP